MKLIIQIPCLNEEETLPTTLEKLPREVLGFDEVEWLVIDDGSSDKTAEIAKSLGVDHVVRHKKNQGLARAFLTGLNESTLLEADVIVNTDADNQYDAAGIPALVAPILEGRADIVIGARPIQEIQHFSRTKRLLQRLGSWVVRRVSFTDLPDVTSGFRALSREAAQRTVVYNEYTYTLETIIQAGHRKLAITSVPVKVNENLRASRLIKNIPSYIKRSMITLVRIYVIYRPFHFFGTIGIAAIGVGAVLGVRFGYYYFTGEGGGHIQSLIIASICVGIGFQTFLMAFIADLFAANRKLLEEIRYTTNKLSTKTDNERNRS